LRPEEAAAHAAQVDDVTHQDQGFDVHVLQEIEEQIGAALPWCRGEHPRWKAVRSRTGVSLEAALVRLLI
jgi:hypothetical protein